VLAKFGGGREEEVLIELLVRITSLLNYISTLIIKG